MYNAILIMLFGRAAIASTHKWLFGSTAWLVNTV